MSPISTNFTEEQQRGAQVPVDVGYIPTDEERRVFRECNQESFWYRSLPFSMVSMAITQALITKGTLSASPRFGSLPKLAFAGFCGYLTGKMSYMKTCQEKFKRLENSPLGEALRKRTGQLPQHSKGPMSELSDPNTQSFDSMFTPENSSNQMSMKSRSRGYNAEQHQQMGEDDFDPPVQAYMEEEEPRKKAILYEDLRIKNRENYEVTLTQKAETLLKTPEREIARAPPKKDSKKNIYGDSWEE